MQSSFFTRSVAWRLKLNGCSIGSKTHKSLPPCEHMPGTCTASLIAQGTLMAKSVMIAKVKQWATGSKLVDLDWDELYQNKRQPSTRSCCHTSRLLLLRWQRLFWRRHWVWCRILFWRSCCFSWANFCAIKRTNPWDCANCAHWKVTWEFYTDPRAARCSTECEIQSICKMCTQQHRSLLTTTSSEVVLIWCQQTKSSSKSCKSKWNCFSNI